MKRLSYKYLTKKCETRIEIKRSMKYNEIKKTKLKECLLPGATKTSLEFNVETVSVGGFK